jgi:hypothetical protein
MSKGRRHKYAGGVGPAEQGQCNGVRLQQLPGSFHLSTAIHSPFSCPLTVPPNHFQKNQTSTKGGEGGGDLEPKIWKFSLVIDSTGEGQEKAGWSTPCSCFGAHLSCSLHAKLALRVYQIPQLLLQ